MSAGGRGMKLTPKQIEVLTFLNDPDVSPASAYAMGCSLGTLNALSLKGLVRIVYGPGHMAFPRHALWRITQAGRKALEGQP